MLKIGWRTDALEILQNPPTRDPKGGQNGAKNDPKLIKKGRKKNSQKMKGQQIGEKRKRDLPPTRGPIIFGPRGGIKGGVNPSL